VLIVESGRLQAMMGDAGHATIYMLDETLHSVAPLDHDD